MIDVFPYSGHWYLAMPTKTPNIIGNPTSVMGWTPSSITGIFLALRGKIYIPVKKKGASRSAFPLSMHVVLKTLYINLKDYVRRF